MAKKVSIQAKDLLLENNKIRFYKGLNYLSLFLYLFCVSICALFVDYLLVDVVEFFIANELAKYPIVAKAFELFKIGSAFLIIIVVIVHACLSTLSQVKFELENFKNE